MASTRIGLMAAGFVISPLIVLGANKNSNVETDWQEVIARCQPPQANEKVVYQEDFRWNYTASEMNARFSEIYSSGKRLAPRAYFDKAANKFVLPFEPMQGGDVVLSQRLITSVRHHIEEALRLSYAQNIFFPDMGHSHFFVEEKSWAEKYDKYPVAKFADMFTALFEDPKLKVLYHTAEQLKMLDDKQQVLSDRETQWRFYTRNIVGDNTGRGSLEIHRDLESSSNTVRDAVGYHYWGSGFNVSASKDGCFPYVHQGKTYYFDLSLSDLPVDPGAH